MVRACAARACSVDPGTASTGATRAACLLRLPNAGRRGRSSDCGPSVEPGFSDRLVAAHDAQAKFDNFGIARIDLEAGPQAVHRCVGFQGGVGYLPRGLGEIEPQAVDFFTGAHEVQNEHPALSIDAGAGASRYHLAQPLWQIGFTEPYDSILEVSRLVWSEAARRA